MIRKVIPLFLFLHFFLLSAAPSFAEIVVIRAEGAVTPVMSEFISKSIDDAVRDKSELLLIELDTPGGLDTSMRSIVKKIIASDVPVAVFVSPSGARAASAGVFITLAAHVAAMSPGTNIGAAHPVNMGGKMDETVAEKAANDAAAYIKSLAEKRGRNADWAEKAVRESVSITESEALKLKVIDYVAKNTQELINIIDGKVTETAFGTVTIKTKGVPVRYSEPGLRHKILDLISNPNVAYMLMLFFEMTNPGSIFPGVFGAISLILAFYSFQTLPVNYAGLMLIILAIVLFILEIKITSFGILTIGGILSMLIGSLMLFDSPLPFYKLSMKVILPGVLLTTLFFVLTVKLAVTAYRRKPVTGIEELEGLEGEARSDVYHAGQVFIHGEIWQAWSEEPIPKGDKVIVESVEH
ncbi:MAG: serine protease, partial [Nitrospira bacterium SG8_35_1]